MKKTKHNKLTEIERAKLAEILGGVDWAYSGTSSPDAGDTGANGLGSNFPGTDGTGMAGSSGGGVGFMDGMIPLTVDVTSFLIPSEDPPSPPSEDPSSPPPADPTSPPDDNGCTFGREDDEEEDDDDDDTGGSS